MDFTTHIIAHQYPLAEDTFETKYEKSKKKKNQITVFIIHLSPF